MHLIVNNPQISLSYISLFLSLSAAAAAVKVMRRTEGIAISTEENRYQVAKVMLPGFLKTTLNLPASSCCCGVLRYDYD